MQFDVSAALVKWRALTMSASPAFGRPISPDATGKQQNASGALGARLSLHANAARARTHVNERSAAADVAAQRAARDRSSHRHGVARFYRAG